MRDRSIPPVVLMLLVVSLFSPVFFTLDGKLFTDPAMLTAPRGVVTNLPIPFSVVTCGVGLAVLFGRWVRDPIVLVLIATVPLMFVTSLVAGAGVVSWTKAKLLLFQFAVPLGGFVLGRQLGRDSYVVRSTGTWLLVVTGVVAIAQLLSTWVRHRSFVLTDDVFGVSIYGHLQYVPPITIAAFVAGLFAAWDGVEHRRALRYVSMALVPVMAAYAAASISVTATLGLWAGLLALATSPFARTRRFVAILVVVSAVLVSGTYAAVATSRAGAFRSKFWGPLTPLSAAAPVALPTAAAVPEPTATPQPLQGPLPNVSERLSYWRYFAAGSTANAHVFLFGHADQPNLSRWPSAHNYYLDLLYTFGLIAMIPLLFLLVWSARHLWHSRAALGRSAWLYGLTFTTVFLLLADNVLRVGMRQPFSGIATFFLWGLLLSALQRNLPANPPSASGESA